MAVGELILVAGALLAGGLAASLLAVRMRVPALVLFLGLGMAIGTDGAGWIDFDDYELARAIGVVALALILFEGGLAAGYRELIPVLKPAISLAVFGTLATAAVTGLGAMLLFDLSLLEGLLVGSILASTDSAAIFALLRDATLSRRLSRTLEGESGLNDPVAVLLVLGFIEWIQRPDWGLADMLWLFTQQLAIGTAVGVLVGGLAVRALRAARPTSTGLYPVASIAAAALAFGAADVIEGSGFLAVYIAGLALGSARIPAKRTVLDFHDGLAWVAQISMFFALGLLVFPSQLNDIALEGTALSLVLVFVARPLAAFAATSFQGFAVGERIVLGWGGLRGAVPVVLATFPVIEGVPGSLEFFNVAFFAVLLSTVLQGSTLEPLARRLGLTERERARDRTVIETGFVRELGADVVEYPVGPDDAVVGRRVRELGLPREAIVTLIVRGREGLLARGSTRIEAGDRLHLIVRQEVSELFGPLQERWRNGPIGPPVSPRSLPFGAASIFTTRPWRVQDGDPNRPQSVLGIEVLERLRARRDIPGALVSLVDGRYAVTGPVLAVGGRRAIHRAARERVGRATSEDEEAWWQEVIGALSR